MRILLTNLALDHRGGTESYLETILPALRRLEHDVVLYSPALGTVAERLRAAGYQVYDDVADLPRDVDVIHGQHVPAVAEIRQVLPAVPLVYVCHSWFLGVEQPIASLGAAAYVALNDRVRDRLLAHAGVEPASVHRLTQPVPMSGVDGLRTPIADRAEVAAVVSRALRARQPELEEACARHGIVLRRIGGESSEVSDPRLGMGSADIVVATGRSAVEAMTLARAVLVADETSTVGWITRESYPAIEAAGFMGAGLAAEPRSLTDLLGDYEPRLGTEARELAASRHPVQLHVAGLVEIYRSVLGRREEHPPADGLAALNSLAVQAQNDLVVAQWDALSVQRQLVLMTDERDHLREQIAARDATIAERDARIGVLLGRVRRSRRKVEALREELAAASPRRFWRPRG